MDDYFKNGQWQREMLKMDIQARACLQGQGDLVRILVTPITIQSSFLFPYLPSPWTFQVGFRAEGPTRVEENFGAYHTIGIQDFLITVSKIFEQ